MSIVMSFGAIIGMICHLIVCVLFRIIIQLNRYVIFRALLYFSFLFFVCGCGGIVHLVAILEIYLAEDKEKFEDGTTDEDDWNGGGSNRSNELMGDSAEGDAVDAGPDASEDQVYIRVMNGNVDEYIIVSTSCVCERERDED